MKRNTIFVLLAGYRDSECEKTIDELFYKSANPQNIFVGICWQYSEDDEFRCFDPEIEFVNNINVKEVHYSESKGVCWARKTAQTYFDQEEYTLIIDSHMLFEKNWDSYFIEQLNKCPSEKPLLSHYPAAYELPEKKIDTPPVINAAHSRINRFKSGRLLPDYNIRGNMFRLGRKYDIDKPIRCFFYAAGFVFGRSQFLEDVPYDPYLDWEEEEIAISLKLWTYGWDLFAPQKHYIYHLYYNSKNSKSPDFRKAVSREKLEKRALISKERFYHLLELVHTNNKEALTDIAAYSLGDHRSVKDFEMAAGIDFERSLTTERSIDCWFALDNINHPMLNHDPSLQDIFSRQYDSVRRGETNTEDGATFRSTESLGENITSIIKNYRIRSVLDLGCGDSNWFIKILENLELVSYQGVDFVNSVIEENKKKFANKTCSFEHADITSFFLRKFDLIFIRDVLPHLKVNNVIKTLVNIKNSNSTYFIASHYLRCDRNRDLNRDGGWHKINLQIPPYNLPEPIEIIEDNTGEGKYLALWKISDIPDFTNASATIESIDVEPGLFKIKKHLSKDECEYLASMKYYKFTEDNNIVLDSATNNPIIQQVFKRTAHFVSDYQEKRAVLFEGDKDLFEPLALFGQQPVKGVLFLTLLYSGKECIEVCVGNNRVGIFLAQGQTLVTNNCTRKIRIHHSSSEGCSDARMLFQYFDSEYFYSNSIPEGSVYDQDDIILNAVGDLILARDMHNYFPKKYAKDILNSTNELLSKGDVNLCNLETVISNIGEMHPKGEKNPYYFRASTTLAPLLAEAHFNVVTTGNNHAMDFGGEALEFQENYLRSANIAHCGSGRNITEARRPIYLNVKNRIICIISFCSVRPSTIGATNESPGVFYIDDPAKISATLAPIIEDAKQKSHLIIVSPHWIENWEETPSNLIRTEARKLMDMGCDVILGHSSHLLHGVEIYDSKPIVYDMGCFLLDRTLGHKDLKRSALFQLVIGKNGISKLIIFPLCLQNGSVDVANMEEAKIVISKLLSIDSSLTSKAEIVNKHISISFDKPSGLLHPKNTTELFHVIKKRASPPLSVLPTDLALNTVPLWYPDFPAIRLQDVWVVDALVPQCFKVGTGFALKVVLRGEIAAENFEVVVSGISHKFGGFFEEVHLLSNGIIHSEISRGSEFLVDYNFVRLNAAIRPGVYTLYWSLRHRESGKYLSADNHQEAVPLGAIYALPENLPNKASGIDWDGKLPVDLKDKFDREFTAAPEYGTLTFIFNSLIGKKSEEYKFCSYAYEQKYSISSENQIVYITLLHKGRYIRWGCTRRTLNMALLRNIEKICSSKHHKSMLQKHRDQLAVKLEIITGEQPLGRENTDNFTMERRGLKLEKDGRSHILLPSEAFDKKILSFQGQYEYLTRLHQIKSPEKFSVYIIESTGHTYYQGKIYEHYECDIGG